ncbi:MAG: DUF3592 domain-containing protein [Spirochaetaceae bacterium]
MRISGALSYFGEKKVRYFYTGIIFAGGVLVLLGIIGYHETSGVPGFWAHTAGRVVYTEKTARNAHIPTVEFSLPRGETVTAASRNSFRRSLEEGEQVHVRFNPLQPEEIVVERSTLLSYPVYLFFGIVLSGFGFRLFIVSLMRSYRIAFIKEHGKRVIPDETAVEEATVRILFVNRRAFFLRCRWKNPLKEEEYTFLSEPLHSPPPLRDYESFGDKAVFVYFLPLSPDKYFIEWRLK